MTSQTFLKLTTLLSAFVFLSGVAMEPQKRSMNDIYLQIKNNMTRYSNAYQWDAIDLKKSINENNVANTVSILVQMADHISNYNQEDIQNLLALVQSYAQELYTQELIGLYAFGTLTRHKDILCHIQALCSAKLNSSNEVSMKEVIEEPEITQKSRAIKKFAIKKSPENTAVEKKDNLKVINASSFAEASADRFAKKLQKKINVIAHARILGNLQQNNVSTGVSSESLNKAGRIWSEELVNSLKKAIATKDEKLISQLWQVNFNDAHAHFKAREQELYERITQRLKKDAVNENDIKWFKERISKVVHKKEYPFTLKSGLKKAADESKLPENTQAKPVINIAKINIMAALNQLKNAITLEAIQAALKTLSEIQITGTFTADETIVLKNQIDQAKQHIYQNCMLGLYGDHEQKLQLNIFDECACHLIGFRIKLSKQLKESDKDIETYVNNADKRKQQCLYEIKVMRSPEKIDAQDVQQGAEWKSRDRDVKTWQNIVQDKLVDAIERQNAPVIQKIMETNFDINKNPLLAENHADVIQSVKNMFNDGKDTANSEWIDNNATIFIPSSGIPKPPAGDPSSTSFFQTCKNHYMLSAMALTAVVAGIYYLWEEWNAEDEDNQSSEANKEKPVEKEKQTDTGKKTKADTTKQAKTA